MSLVTYPLNNIEYSAEDAELYNSARTSGVFSNSDFEASFMEMDSIQIGEGIGWIQNGKFKGKVIALKVPESVSFDVADALYDRYDIVAIQFDAVKNATNIVVKKGNASSSPQYPERVQTESLYELYLYACLIRAGVGYDPEYVNDLRGDPQYCGLVSSAIGTLFDYIDFNERSNVPQSADMWKTSDGVIHFGYNKGNFLGNKTGEYVTVGGSSIEANFYANESGLGGDFTKFKVLSDQEDKFLILGETSSATTLLWEFVNRSGQSPVRLEIRNNNPSTNNSIMTKGDFGDFIVDQGQANGWTYVKYDSGRAECWGVGEHTNVPISKAWGSLYISNATFQSAFPFAFAAAPVVSYTIESSSSCWGMPSGSGFTSETKTGVIQLCRATSAEDLTVRIHWYAVGRWK